MNCLYETVAQAYMRVRSRFVPAIHDNLGDAEEALETCRANLAAKERDAASQCSDSTRAALSKRKAGDIGGAKFHLQVLCLLYECLAALLTTSFARDRGKRAFLLLAWLTPLSFCQERKRGIARLEKIRNGLALLDKQLDALRSSELDKELMNSIRASSQAMRNAGIGLDAGEAEKAMNELDDQMREASELTTVLATPLMAGEDDSDGAFLGVADVDAELGLIEEEDSHILAVMAESLPGVPGVPWSESAPPTAVRAPPAASGMV
jgi:hypothetical protein